MNSRNWHHRYLAYCRAHGIDGQHATIHAADFQAWVATQRQAFEAECPDIDFDAWLGARHLAGATA